MKRSWGPVVGLALLLAALGCAKPPEESENRRNAFFEVAGGRIFLVDDWGTREPIKFQSFTPDRESYYLAVFLAPGSANFFTLTDSLGITTIDLGLKTETQLMKISLPGGGGTVRASRMGWAGQRVYLLADIGDGDTFNHGVILAEADWVSQQTKVLLGPLDHLGGGRDQPVSFDLANGGNQAFVLYDSGELVAYNILLDDDDEGLIAAVGAGARDLHVMPNLNVYVAGMSGLYLVDPGGGVSRLNSLPGLRLCRVRDLQEREILVADVNQAITKILLPISRSSLLLEAPDLITAMAPVPETWIKKTKPIISDPLSNPPYLKLMPNVFLLSFVDPEGDHANITITLSADPSQNMYFLSGGNTINIPDITAGDIIDASFYGGDIGGDAEITIEAVSTDGQIGRRVFPIPVQ